MDRRNLICREISIDAAHRIPDHLSKCRNLHGHRYRIEATCCGTLATSGDQAGMVLDFGFLKQEMMDVIDTPCDHGLLVWVNDPLLEQFLPATDKEAPDVIALDQVERAVARDGQAFLQGRFGKTLVLPVIPTAENLARFWFEQLVDRVEQRSNGRAKLQRIDVWETPNCRACYQPD